MSLIYTERENKREREKESESIQENKIKIRNEVVWQNSEISRSGKRNVVREIKHYIFWI